MKSILWADDEIEHLKPHILFLEEKGYNIEPVSNGSDAIEYVKNKTFDIIFLDEQMPGLDGIQVLSKIKLLCPHVPVVMITKSESESTIDKAIGKNIAEYLIKPVKPKQIWLACKKILESDAISSREITQSYTTEFNNISSLLSQVPSPDQWIDIYKQLTYWELEVDKYKIPDLGEMLAIQKKEANKLFCKFIETSYSKWCFADKDERPLISVDMLEKKIIPEMRTSSSTFLFVVDCMRYDQWLIIQDDLTSFFDIETDLYYSILPTATGFCRNALFSGLFPADIQRKFPQYWNLDSNEHTQNAFEAELLNEFFKRKRLASNKIKYTKLSNQSDSKLFFKEINNFLRNALNATVINFVDILTHTRTSSNVVRELSPDETAFRGLTKTWFAHSYLLKTLKKLSSEKNITILITTDHGSIRCMRSSKVGADKEASTNMRYKLSKRIAVDPKQAIYVREPNNYRLPSNNVSSSFAIAKEDYFFVYPNNFHKFVQMFKDSFQHGGVSMEEMIVPFAKLTPKK